MEELEVAAQVGWARERLKELVPSVVGRRAVASERVAHGAPGTHLVFTPSPVYCTVVHPVFAQLLTSVGSAG